MSRPLWQGFSWSGDEGEFVANVRRYKSGRYAVKGRLRVTSRDPWTIDIPEVTVTDHESGATLTTTDDGKPVVVTLPAETSPTDVSEFWRNARYLSGVTRAQLGRPRGTNAVDDAGGDEEIRRIVADLRRNHRRVTLHSIETASGVFSRDNLRRWLRENGKKLADY